MGREYLAVDAAAVRAVAERFNTAADLIDAAVHTRLSFDGAAAGRAHIAEGDALRRTLDRWTVEFARWSRATAEIAAVLRSGAQRYTDAELRTADRLG